MQFKYSDGGRKDSGFSGYKKSDCVVRAIAIASGKPYKEVYESLEQRNQEYADNGWGRVAKALRKKGSAPSRGNFKKIYHEYIQSIGFEWISCMGIGTGCKVHLKASELPMGNLIARVSKHLVAIIDGVMHDTHDCSRAETRCVYGYYKVKA